MGDLWALSVFFRHSKGEGGIRGQSACDQPAGERRQASGTGKNLKGEWTSRTITGASNNCIHLPVLATSHCLSLRKIAVFWICKILQCKLSPCYFSILRLAVSNLTVTFTDLVLYRDLNNCSRTCGFDCLFDHPKMKDSFLS